MADLTTVLRALGRWQRADLALQLHPGDLGWCWRLGSEATAAATRTWTRDGDLVAVGLLDGPVLRLALAPESRQDDGLARRLVADMGAPERGVLGEGEAFLEASCDALVHERLDDAGWPVDAPWTPLRRDLVAGP